MDEGDDVLEEGDSQTEGSRRSSQISEGSRFLQDGVGNGGQDSKSSMNRNRHSRILDAKQGEVEDMGLQVLGDAGCHLCTIAKLLSIRQTLWAGHLWARIHK